MTEIKKRENNTVYFDIVIKNEDIKKAETEVYKKNKKYFQLPGFRKGHVPRKLIENMYGKDVFFEDAINEILPGKYEEVVKELELNVIDEPHVDIDEETKDKEEVIVNVHVELMPEVEIDNYKGLELEDRKKEVTDEIIDAELENQRSLNARIINVDDRAVEKNDKVNIDFKGSVDGEYFDGGEGEGQDLEIGSNTFIPGFEEKLIGHEVGEEFNIDVKFPEDYFEKNLKGKDAKFEIKINSISYEELPEVDDEFIKDISEFDTVDEYKADVKRKKEEEYKLNREMDLKNQATNKLGELVDIEVPNVLVERQIDNILANYDQNLRMQGISLEDYVKMIGSSMDVFRDNAREDATRQVKNDLALSALIKKENFEVSDEEIEKEVDTVVNDYFKNDKEHMEKMRNYMLNENKEVVRDDLEKRKAIDFLVENAKLVEPKEVDNEEVEKEIKEENKEEKED